MSVTDRRGVMTQCKATVRKPGLGFGFFRSCSRKAVRDGFCGQHHPDAAAKRAEKAQRMFDMRAEHIRTRTLAIGIGFCVINELREHGIKAKNHIDALNKWRDLK